MNVLKGRKWSFVNLVFSRSIGEVEKSEDVEERISDLNRHFTSIVYQSISRSLFQVNLDLHR